MKTNKRDKQIELALNEVLFGHRIVFEALEMANRTSNRAVLLGEVINALTKKQLSVLKGSYVNPLIDTVRQILKLLINRKLVFIARSDRHRHYYAAASVFNRNEMPFEFYPSYRQRVISLLRDVIKHYNRPVRIGDIDNYLDKVRPDIAGDHKWFRPTIKRLTAEGIVKAVIKRRQVKCGGHFYLLSGMDPSSYPSPELSRLEAVLMGFRELWEKETETARFENRPPSPITTEEIKNYIYNKFPKNILPHKRNLTEALIALSKQSSNIAIRRLKRDSYSKALWVPVEVKDDELEINGAPKGDSEKVYLAVEYAVKRLRRPVKVKDIKNEMNIHAELQITTENSLGVLLNTQAKFSKVKRAGWINGEYYYFWGNKNSPLVKGYLTLKKIEGEWEKLDALLELNDLSNCSLELIAYGRCLLIKNAVEHLIPDLLPLGTDKEFGSVVNMEAQALHKQAEDVYSKAELWLKQNVEFTEGFPKSVNQNIPGVTAGELWELLQLLYPVGRKVETAALTSNLLSHDVRRIKNPLPKPVRCDGTRETVLYLFDRADAYIYIAHRWGGSEAGLQATLAKNNLGLLRDINFVLPCLSSCDYNDRLIAVACLAFLQVEGGLEALYNVCLKDADRGVRESALWAYAFIGGDMKALNDNLKQVEKNKSILDFAKRLESCSPAEVWCI